MNPSDNRFYLQALGIAGLFIVLLFVLWIASGGPASEAEVQHASSTRTAIAMTEVFLLRPYGTDTPPFIIPTSFLQTSTPGSTSITPSAPAAASTPSPSPTALGPLPVTATGVSHAQPTKASASFPPAVPVTGAQDPAEFARWYFARVWKERDYQNLWDNYLTASFKASVGSGLFEDYVGWWNSVKRVDVTSVEVIRNNGADAWVRVNLTFHMKDGNVLSNQVFEYDFLYDPSRNTWMFDHSP